MSAIRGSICHLVYELLAKAKKTGHYLLSDRYTDPEYLTRVAFDRFAKEEGDRFEFTKKDFKFCLDTVMKVYESDLCPLNLNIIDIEKRFSIPIKHPDFEYKYYDVAEKTEKTGYMKLRGTIDLITEEDPDTLHLRDYKTGKYRSCWVTGEEKDYKYLLEKDVQLRIYDLAASILYPHKHRLVSINYIWAGGNFTVSFDDDDRKKTYEILKQHFNEVNANNLPDRIKNGGREKELFKCRYTCHYGKKSANDGPDTCDKIYNYMLAHGIDETIMKIRELRGKQSDDANVRASDRRNVY